VKQVVQGIQRAFDSFQFSWIALLCLFLPIWLFLWPPSNILRDGDTLWLLKTGFWILDHGRIPASNVLAGGYEQLAQWPLVCYQWLFQVLLAGIYRLMGFYGVVWLSASLLILSIPVMARWLERLGFQSGLERVLALLVALVPLGYFLLARPMVASLLFVCLEALVLTRFHRQDKSQVEGFRPQLFQALFWAIFFAVWANLHLGFIFGLIVLAVYQLEACLRERRWQPLTPLMASALATGLNPSGFALYPYLSTLAGSPYMNANIRELQPVNFHNHPALHGYFLLVFLAFAVGWRDSRIRLAERACCLLSLWMALFLLRHLFYLMVFITPFMASLAHTGLNQLTGLLPWSRKLGPFLPKREAVWRWMAVSLILGLGLAVNQSFPIRIPHVEGLKGFLQYTEAHPIGRPLLTLGTNGDVLLWKSKERALIDTRFDMYGDAYVAGCMQAYRLAPGWEKFFRQHAVHDVLYPSQPAYSNMVSILVQLHGWQVRYRDAHVTWLSDYPSDSRQINTIRQSYDEERR
jgi:hypothetical protein